MSDFVLAESFGRKNFQDRLYYVMDVEDLEELQSQKNIVMGDKAYIIKQGKMVIAGNDGQWYDVSGGSASEEKQDAEISWEDIEYIGTVSYVPDENDIEDVVSSLSISSKGETRSAADSSLVTTEEMGFYDFSNVNIVSIDGSEVDTEVKHLYAYGGGGGGTKGFYGDNSGQYFLAEDTDALAVYHKDNGDRMSSKYSSGNLECILLMPGTEIVQNPDYNGGVD